jgi:excisionase family DNA binding protein
MGVKNTISPDDSKVNDVFESVEELASYLRLSRHSTYRGLNDGTIPGLRVGKRIVISRRAVDTWLATAGGKLAGADLTHPVSL